MSIHCLVRKEEGKGGREPARRQGGKWEGREGKERRKEGRMGERKGGVERRREEGRYSFPADEMALPLLLLYFLEDVPGC